jgi:hypothetical protein
MERENWILCGAFAQLIKITYLLITFIVRITAVENEQQTQQLLQGIQTQA